jgi:pimeloyl-ACP methyl ester carboxylesterase
MLPTPYESSYVETNGIRLHVVTAGPKDGKPILLLHGFPEFWYGWKHQIPALAQAGFRVIAPDQRGYNLSDAPKGIRPYCLPELGRDVIGLLDHFGVDKANLVGHDWGALVAWGVALTFPERVERLGILNVPHPAVFVRFLMRSPRQMLKSWYVGFFQIPGLADGWLKRDDFALGAQMMRRSGKANTFSDEDMARYKKAWANTDGLTAMINWYRALVRYTPPMPGDIRLRMPVLIQWGKHDAFLSHEMAGESLKLCDSGRLIVYENATHWVQHDEAEAVNRELIQFFHDY